MEDDGWGAGGDMIDVMTNHLIRRRRGDHGREDGDPGRAAHAVEMIERRPAADGEWAVLSERTDLQEVAP